MFFVDSIPFVFILFLGSLVLAEKKEDKAKTSVPLSFSGIDFVLNPFKKLIVENIPINNEEEQNSLSGECNTDEITDGFINFSKLYTSEDFPREDVKDFHAVPLMIFVSVVILVMWILVTLCSCCFRCCWRRTKCCNPVLYGSKGKRKRCEVTCVIVYIIALACFVAAAALCITTFTSTPKIGTHLSENMVSPLTKYVKNIPARFSNVINNLDSTIETGSATILGKMKLDDVVNNLTKYATTRFENEVKFVECLGDTVKGQDYNKLFDNANGLITELGNLNTTISKSTGSQEIVDAIAEVYESVSGYSGSLDDYKYPTVVNTIVNKIKKSLGISDQKSTEGNNNNNNNNNNDSSSENKNENENDLSISNILNTILKIDEMLNGVINCLLDGGNNVSTCISNSINEGIQLEKAGSIASDYVMSLIESEETDSETGETEPSLLESIEEAMTTYTELAAEILELVNSVLSGNFTPVLDMLFPEEEEDSGENGMSSNSFNIESYANEENEESGSLFANINVRQVAEKVLPLFLPIICCIIALIMAIYIIPVAVALCCVKKAKKKGSGQCRCCIRCSTCCFACGTPLIMIIVSIIGLALAVVYITILAVLLSSDESNFGTDGNNDDAPIGEAFSDCIAKGYLKKENILNLFLNDSNGENPDEQISGNSFVIDKLEQSSTEKEKSWVNELLEGIISDASVYAINHLNELLSCKAPKGTLEFKPGDIVLSGDKEYDDTEIIKSYGTFANSINFKAIIFDPVGKQLTTELLMKIFNYDSTSCPDGDAIVCIIDKYIESYITDETIKDNIVNRFDDFNTMMSDVKTYKTTLDEIFKIFYIKKNNDSKRYSESRTLRCDSSVLKPFIDIAKNVNSSSGINSNLKEDLNTLATCSNTGVESIELKHYNIYEIVDQLNKELCGGSVNPKPTECDDYSKLLGLMGTINKSTEIMKPFSDNLFKNIDNISSQLNTCLDDYKKNYKNTMNTPLGEDTVDSVIGLLDDTLDIVANELSKMSNSVLGGALSCYPIGATKTGVIVMADDVSENYTKFTIALLVLAVGCLIMIVTTNLGPMVAKKDSRSHSDSHNKESKKKHSRSYSSSESYSYSESSSSDHKKSHHSSDEPTKIIVLGSEGSSVRDAKYIKAEGRSIRREVFSSTSETSRPQFSSPISIYLASEYTSINAQSDSYAPQYQFHALQHGKMHQKDKK